MKDEAIIDAIRTLCHAFEAAGLQAPTSIKLASASDVMSLRARMNERADVSSDSGGSFRILDVGIETPPIPVHHRAVD